MKICPTCQIEYPVEVDFCPTDGMKLRAPRATTDDPLVGRALDDRWIIEEKLGEGGMGAVYRGHQRSVNRTVAIKTLRPQLVESDEFVNRFFREAQIAANISHPHCVTILDYGEAKDGTLYLAMEFLDGELLTDRIESGTLTVKQIVEIGVQVASALSAAHDQHIVHRDLKPDNIYLLDVPGGATFAKVLDFGIAKMLDSNTQVTKTGMIFGTPEYMSPEQCRGGAIDGRSDLYALGCILYELVGGRTPFGSTTPMAVLMAHVNEQAPALFDGGTAAFVPPGVESIIMRLLEKDPDDRYPSAAAVREALEAEIQRLENPSATASSVKAIVAPAVQMGFDQTAGMPAPAEAASAAFDADQAFDDGPAPPAGSSRAVMGLLIGVVTLVMLLVGVIVFLLNGDAGNGPDEVVAAEPPKVIEAAPSPVAAPPIVEAAPTVEPVVVVDEPVAEPEKPEEAPEAKVAVAPAATKKRKQTSKPKPKPEPKPVVTETKEAEPKPPAKTAEAEPPAEDPEPAKRPAAKINEKAERLKKGVEKKVKGLDKKFDSILDGMME